MVEASQTEAPTIRQGAFGFFDTGGRFWTPDWDHTNNKPRDVAEVLTLSGDWHRFDSFVSTTEATLFRIATRNANTERGVL